MKRNLLALAAITALVAFSAGNAAADTIRVQSTTDTVDAGLVDGLLKPAYAAAQPGDTLSYVGVGTGAALTNAQNGLADVVITHAPSLEATFVSNGFSLEPFGRAIFFSDYVIIGPAADPAGVFTDAPHDAITALEKIAAAGTAGTASFVSRGDNSGTNVQEQLMWGMTGSVVPKHIASNAAGNNLRFEPGAATIPSWYVRTSKGQAANVQEADACPVGTYPNGGCYTMTDRGTFNKLINSGTITHLKVVSDKNLTTARGGENLLVNPFSAYIVSPMAALPPGSPVPNVAAATRFLDFLTSPAFQTAVDGFPTASDPAFHSDAFPAVGVDTPLPPTLASGSTVNVPLTITNKLPGGGAVSGIPAHLQQSTDGGNTYTDVGATVATDSAGKVTLTTPIFTTTTYRLVLPRYHQFSPSNVVLGVVTVPIGVAPPPGTGTGTPPPAAKPAPVITDHFAPVTSAIKLSRRQVSFGISEPGAIKVTFKRRSTKKVRRKGKVFNQSTYKTVKSVTIIARSKGTVSSSFSSLARGTYKIVILAGDLSGNVRSRTVSRTVT